MPLFPLTFRFGNVLMRAIASQLNTMKSSLGPREAQEQWMIEDKSEEQL
jgi:hypothetical protein